MSEIMWVLAVPCIQWVSLVGENWQTGYRHETPPRISHTAENAFSESASSTPTCYFGPQSCSSPPPLTCPWPPNTYSPLYSSDNAQDPPPDPSRFYPGTNVEAPPWIHHPRPSLPGIGNIPRASDPLGGSPVIYAGPGSTQATKPKQKTSAISFVDGSYTLAESEPHRYDPLNVHEREPSTCTCGSTKIGTTENGALLMHGSKTPSAVLEPATQMKPVQQVSLVQENAKPTVQSGAVEQDLKPTEENISAGRVRTVQTQKNSNQGSVIKQSRQENKNSGDELVYIAQRPMITVQKGQPDQKAPTTTVLDSVPGVCKYIQPPTLQAPNHDQLRAEPPNKLGESVIQASKPLKSDNQLTVEPAKILTGQLRSDPVQRTLSPSLGDNLIAEPVQSVSHRIPGKQSSTEREKEVEDMTLKASPQNTASKSNVISALLGMLKINPHKSETTNKEAVNLTSPNARPNQEQTDSKLQQPKNLEQTKEEEVRVPHVDGNVSLQYPWPLSDQWVPEPALLEVSPTTIKPSHQKRSHRKANIQANEPDIKAIQQKTVEDYKFMIANTPHEHLVQDFMNEIQNMKEITIKNYKDMIESPVSNAALKGIMTNEIQDMKENTIKDYKDMINSPFYDTTEIKKKVLRGTRSKAQLVKELMIEIPTMQNNAAVTERLIQETSALKAELISEIATLKDKINAKEIVEMKKDLIKEIAAVKDASIRTFALEAKKSAKEIAAMKEEIIQKIQASEKANQHAKDKFFRGITESYTREITDLKDPLIKGKEVVREKTLTTKPAKETASLNENIGRDKIEIELSRKLNEEVLRMKELVKEMASTQEKISISAERPVKEIQAMREELMKEISAVKDKTTQVLEKPMKNIASMQNAIMKEIVIVKDKVTQNTKPAENPLKDIATVKEELIKEIAAMKESKNQRYAMDAVKDVTARDEIEAMKASTIESCSTGTEKPIKEITAIKDELIKEIASIKDKSTENCAKAAEKPVKEIAKMKDEIIKEIKLEINNVAERSRKGEFTKGNMEQDKTGQKTEITTTEELAETVKISEPVTEVEPVAQQLVNELESFKERTIQNAVMTSIRMKEIAEMKERLVQRRAVADITEAGKNGQTVETVQELVTDSAMRGQQKLSKQTFDNCSVQRQCGERDGDSIKPETLPSGRGDPKEVCFKQTSAETDIQSGEKNSTHRTEPASTAILYPTSKSPTNSNKRSSPYFPPTNPLPNKRLSTSTVGTPVERPLILTNQVQTDQYTKAPTQSEGAMAKSSKGDSHSGLPTQSNFTPREQNDLIRILRKGVVPIEQSRIHEYFSKNTRDFHASGNDCPPTNPSNNSSKPYSNTPLQFDSEPPSSRNPASKPPSSRNPTSRPFSSGSPTGKPPSSGSPTGKPPSSGSPTGKPPSSGSPTGKPPSSGSPTGKPSSSGSPTGKSPSLGSPTGKPPSSGSPTGKPSSSRSSVNKPPSCSSNEKPPTKSSHPGLGGSPVSTRSSRGTPPRSGLSPTCEPGSKPRCKPTRKTCSPDSQSFSILDSKGSVGPGGQCQNETFEKSSLRPSHKSSTAKRSDASAILGSSNKGHKSGSTLNPISEPSNAGSSLPPNVSGIFAGVNSTTNGRPRVATTRDGISTNKLSKVDVKPAEWDEQGIAKVRYNITKDPAPLSVPIQQNNRVSPGDNASTPTRSRNTPRTDEMPWRVSNSLNHKPSKTDNPAKSALKERRDISRIDLAKPTTQTDSIRPEDEPTGKPTLPMVSSLPVVSHRTLNPSQRGNSARLANTESVPIATILLLSRAAETLRIKITKPNPRDSVNRKRSGLIAASTPEDQVNNSLPEASDNIGRPRNTIDITYHEGPKTSNMGELTSSEVPTPWSENPQQRQNDILSKLASLPAVIKEREDVKAISISPAQTESRDAAKILRECTLGKPCTDASQNITKQGKKDSNTVLQGEISIPERLEISPSEVTTQILTKQLAKYNGITKLERRKSAIREGLQKLKYLREIYKLELPSVLKEQLRALLPDPEEMDRAIAEILSAERGSQRCPQTTSFREDLERAIAEILSAEQASQSSQHEAPKNAVEFSSFSDVEHAIAEILSAERKASRSSSLKQLSSASIVEKHAQTRGSKSLAESFESQRDSAEPALAENKSPEELMSKLLHKQKEYRPRHSSNMKLSEQVLTEPSRYKKSQPVRKPSIHLPPVIEIPPSNNVDNQKSQLTGKPTSAKSNSHHDFKGPGAVSPPTTVTKTPGKSLHTAASVSRNFATRIGTPLSQSMNTDQNPHTKNIVECKSQSGPPGCPCAEKSERGGTTGRSNGGNTSGGGGYKANDGSLPTKINDGLNIQVATEMGAFLGYFKKMAHFGRVDVAYRGLESFFRKQVQEEREHALEIASWTNLRGGKNVMGTVESASLPETMGSSHTKALAQAVAMETSVTQSLHQLRGSSKSCYDVITSKYISKLHLREQAESVDEISRLVTNAQRAESSPREMLAFDESLYANYKSN